MSESFITAFIVYFVVVDPIGNAPIFIAVTQYLDRAAKTRAALESTFIASGIMLFFALCGSWILGYLNISMTGFKIAGGIILLIVALDMLQAKRQNRKKEGSNSACSTDHNVAIFPLAIPLLAGPAGYNLSYGSIRRPCRPRYAGFNWLWCTWCGDGNNRHDPRLDQRSTEFH